MFGCIILDMQTTQLRTARLLFPTSHVREESKNKKSQYKDYQKSQEAKQSKKEKEKETNLHLPRMPPNRTAHIPIRIRQPLNLIVRPHHRDECIRHNSDGGRARGEVRVAFRGGDTTAGGVEGEVEVREEPRGGDGGPPRAPDVVERRPLLGGELGRGECEGRHAYDGARCHEA